MAFFALSACGDDAPPAPDTGPDAEVSCSSDSDCDDGLYCNGEESCNPEHAEATADGCVAAVPPCAQCNEETNSCEGECANGDQDGDGHLSQECGGNDCDDNDPLRFPGATEICDPDNRDEDCDPTTAGFRDADGDGYSDARCCNVDDSGNLNCGEDCSDVRPSAHPGLPETCDGDDNDCDGMVDEGVLRTFFVDADNDGRGDSNAETMDACFPPMGYSEVGGDCDDTNPGRHPGLVEICDEAGLDENCDDIANPDELCMCSGSETQSCARPGACSAGIERCSDGFWGACSIVAAIEVCNEIDDDCDNSTDEGTLKTCYEDPDDDGYAASGAVERELCPISGRAAVEGCPIGFTHRRPQLPDLDCNDNSDSTYPGAPELCNGVNDDCDGAIDENLRVVVRYIDRDMDGFRGEPVMRCEGDPDSVAVSEDCNENNARVYVGAVEYCDGIDNNCGLGGAAAGGPDMFEDQDGDGFAAPNAQCTDDPDPMFPAEAIFPKTDCNDDPSDGGAADNPSRAEVCSGRDTNCDGTIDEDPAAFDSCIAANASAGCALDGTCRVFSCDFGFADCNGNFDDGCEVDVSSDSANCGGCGVACGGGAACTNGFCPGILDIEGGRLHTCLLFTDGSMACSGRNRNVQLGDGSRTDRSFYSATRDVTNAVGAGLGQAHSCAVLSDGTAACWGDGRNGRLGTGNAAERFTATPVIGLGGSLVEVVAGWDFSCGRLDTGVVQCWGNNSHGQLGNNDLGNESLSPVNVAGITDAVDISSVNRTVCAVRTGGTVECWGQNDVGQAGNGMGTDAAAPVPVTGVTTALSVAAGAAHACALLADQTVVCWGNEANGRLGNNSTTNTMVTATPVNGLSEVTLIEAGTGTTCAVHGPDDQVSCWGAGGSGNLGNGSMSHSPVPVEATGVDGVLDLAIGNTHVCALRTGERVSCWGGNDFGQFGNLTTVNSNVATDVPSLLRIPEVAAGATVAFGRRANGTVAGWGDNVRGQLGLGVVGGARRVAPVEIPGLTAAQIDTSAEYSCAVDPTGQLLCWGRYPTAGSDIPTPTAIAGLNDIVRVAAGLFHLCTIDAAGVLACFGGNGSGMVGDGTLSAVNTPYTHSLVDVRDVHCSRSSTCAVQANGDLYCWGSNSFGQIGTGSTGGTVRSPRRVDFFDDATRVVAGNGHTVALRATGEVMLFGRRVESGGAVTQPIPTPIVGLPGGRVIDLDTTNGGQICVVFETGEMYCWGSDNPHGELGIGDQLPQPDPTQVLFLSDFSAVSAGGSRTCGVRDSNQALACWGLGGYTGDGTTMTQVAPVSVINFP